MTWLDAISILLEYYGAQDLQGSSEFLTTVASVGMLARFDVLR